MLSFFLFKGDGNSYYATTGYLNNIPHFLRVYLCDNPRGILGENEKSLQITSPNSKTSDLQTFRVFPQRPKWIITQVNP